MSVFLESLQGGWEGTTTTWFEPGPGFQDSWKVRFRLLQGGSFLLQEHSSEVQGAPHQGCALLGHDSHDGYSMALADSFHTSGTGLLQSTGGLDPTGRLSLLGHYDASGQRWGWRTLIGFEGDVLVLQAFNISPEGQESLAVETRLVRAT